MTKVKCLICGYFNELGSTQCVECQTVFDPTVTNAAPRPTRQTTDY
jgi:hypothetical protein